MTGRHDSFDFVCCQANFLTEDASSTENLHILAEFWANLCMIWNLWHPFFFLRYFWELHFAQRLKITRKVLFLYVSIEQAFEFSCQICWFLDHIVNDIMRQSSLFWTKVTLLVNFNFGHHVSDWTIDSLFQSPRHTIAIASIPSKAEKAETEDFFAPLLDFLCHAISRNSRSKNALCKNGVHLVLTTRIEDVD